MSIQVSIAFRLTDGFGLQTEGVRLHNLILGEVSIAFRLTDGFGRRKNLAETPSSAVSLNCLSAY